MKDMFYNYDNCIENKDNRVCCCDVDEKSSSLENNSGRIQIVYNAKGEEIGVRASYNNPFKLYFMLDGCVEGMALEEFLAGSTAIFELYTNRHKVKLSKEITEGFYDNTLCVEISKSDLEKLERGIYKMKLLLNYAVGADLYVLFDENNGFLSLI